MEELINSETENAPVKTSEPTWYKNVSYEDAKVFIKSNITSAARSFIAIGYYLKLVRDKEMFREDGHETIWDFAQAEYGISKSTASRYMTMNDRFSNGGNSPVIKDEYKEFGKSQLQEMLSLTDEQMEQVSSSDRVEDIRNIRKPKEIPYVHIPGQVELSDFPGVEPEDVAAAVKAREAVATSHPDKQIYTISAEDLLPDPPAEQQTAVAISQQDQLEKTGKCIHRPEFECTLEEAHKLTPGIGDDCSQVCCWECVKHGDCYLECYSSARRPVETAAKTQQEEPLSVYGTPKNVYPEDSLLVSPGCEGDHNCFCCAMDCQIRQEDRYCREAPMGNPFPCEMIDRIPILRDKAGDRCQFADMDLACHREGDHEPVPCCKECKNPCDHICSRARKSLEENRNRTGEEERVDESYNIGDLPQAREMYLRQLARVLVKKNGAQMVYGAGRSVVPSDEVIKKEIMGLDRKEGGSIKLEDGVVAYASQEIIEFFRGEEDLGVCTYARFATQVRKALDEWAKTGKDVKQEITSASEPVETVVDGTFTEVQEKLTPKYFLEEQKEKLDRLLKTFEGKEVNSADEKFIERQKTIVCALAVMVCEQDRTELQEQLENENPDQPELPLLKNNDQRAAFVDGYETWPLWVETVQTGERYYRYDLEDGTSMVVKVYHAMLFDGFAEGSYKSLYHEGYGRQEYYLLQEGKFFRDCDTNRSLLIEKLKEIQKVKKGEK